jgi:hypothetical protein
MNPRNRKQSKPLPAAKESLSPLEVTARRFGVKPKDVADQRIASLVDWKTRLEAKCNAMKSDPELRAHMIARVRTAKGFAEDEQLPRAVESLICGIAESLIFLGKLRPLPGKRSAAPITQPKEIKTQE